MLLCLRPGETTATNSALQLAEPSRPVAQGLSRRWSDSPLPAVLRPGGAGDTAFAQDFLPWEDHLLRWSLPPCISHRGSAAWLQVPQSPSRVMETLTTAAFWITNRCASSSIASGASGAPAASGIVPGTSRSTSSAVGG